MFYNIFIRPIMFYKTYLEMRLNSLKRITLISYDLSYTVYHIRIVETVQNYLTVNCIMKLSHTLCYTFLKHVMFNYKGNIVTFLSIVEGPLSQTFVLEFIFSQNDVTRNCKNE
jgi:hypothetical protein